MAPFILLGGIVASIIAAVISGVGSGLLVVIGFLFGAFYMAFDWAEKQANKPRPIGEAGKQYFTYCYEDETGVLRVGVGHIDAAGFHADPKDTRRSKPGVHS